MSVFGRLDKYSKAGAVHARHVVVEDKTGPGSDVTVAAGGTNTVTFSIADVVPRNIEYAGVEYVSGIPSGLYIQGISFDKDGKTLTITFHNPGDTDITIKANSLTVRVVSVA